MKRIIIYVLIISNLSIILGLEQQKNKTAVDIENEKRENFTLAIRQYLPEEEENGFAKRVLSPRSGSRSSGFSSGRKPKQMLKTPGLEAYASKDPPMRNRRRNFGSGRRKPPPRPFLHEPAKNFKNYNWAPEKGRGERTAKLAFNFNKNNYKNIGTENEDQRRHRGDWRTARFNNGKHTSKVCNPCNDVPWVPLFKVPHSYRQQRTHKQELPKIHHHDFSIDFKALATEAENLLLPPTPLGPPLEPIYDGTISSSFGLPIGNIPTGHGLLAPLNHIAPNHYVDFSNSLQLLPTQTVVETSIIPQLSPVPVVPIHDSGQFFQVDPTTSDLVSPTKPVDVSNVVLTISENSHGKLNPDSIKLQAVASQEVPKASPPAVGSYTNEELYPPLNKPLPGFGQVEIIKSIPLIEFSSTVTYPQPSLQVPSVLPPLKFHLQSVPLHPPAPPPEHHIKKDVSASEKVTDFNFLVPPPVRKQESDTSFNTSKNEVLPFLNPPKKSNVQYHEQVKASTVPRPLTSPSLSWLFSDQSPTSTTSRTTLHALHQLASDSQQIASIVNNELRPVSPQIDIDTEPTTDSSRSKKIQIIIPYTTKNKKDQDNNALESVSRQVFHKTQPPVSISTNNNSSRDSANSGLASSSGRVHQSLNGKVIDENRKDTTLKTDLDDHLTEMQHIIATNIRELLRKEIQKSQYDQNYPLQNNIDNWTALEYSNHKTIGEKAPKEIINQALAVTSIPGTSISHLLLPSKKIPKEYFSTTSLPVFDEPNTLPFNATKTTVDSRPFTARPYATTNFYQPTGTLWKSTPVNHDTNYTEVERGRVNHWGRLNENLVLPEPARTRTGKPLDSTTPSLLSTFLSSSVGNEKVEIVTPVSSFSRKRNYTTLGYRRTTREVRVTEKPETFKVSSVFPLKNSTKLEKVSNFRLGQRVSSALGNFATFGRNRSESSMIVSSGNSSRSSFSSSSSSSSGSSPSFFSNQTLPLNFSSEQLLKLSRTNRSELFSINDIFPFRNEQLPWESNSNVSQINFRNGRLRKSLIKLMKLKAKAKTSADSS